MEIIEEKLGVTAPILARTMFHGQHSMNELLEATDAKLKEELSLVVPLELWQTAAGHTRMRVRDTTKRVSELQGMISLREGDVENLHRRCANAEADLKAKEMALAAKEEEMRMQQESNPLVEDGDSQQSPEILKQQISEAAALADTLRSEVRQLNDKREAITKSLYANITVLIELAQGAAENQQNAKLEFQSLVHSQESLQSRVQKLETMWLVDLSSGAIPTGFIVPDTCPTCFQPISTEGLVASSSADGHSHDNLQTRVEEEIRETLSKLTETRGKLVKSELALEQAESNRKNCDSRVGQAQEELKEKTRFWEEQVSGMAEKLRLCERDVMSLSESYKILTEREQQSALTASLLQSKLSSEREAVRYAGDALRDLSKDLDVMKTKIEELRADIQKQQSIGREMSSLTDAFGNRGIQTYVLQAAVNELQSMSQKYLDEFSDGAQRLHLSLDAGDKISRKALMREPDGTFKERPLASISGGQWRRCSLALALGFADLVARRGRLCPSMIVLDEPLTHLDQSGRSQVGKVLRKILGRHAAADKSNETADGIRGISQQSASTIILILQDLAAEELEEAFDHIDEVVKEGGSSFVQVDEGG